MAAFTSHPEEGARPAHCMQAAQSCTKSKERSEFIIDRGSAAQSATCGAESNAKPGRCPLGAALLGGQNPTQNQKEVAARSRGRKADSLWFCSSPLFVFASLLLFAFFLICIHLRLPVVCMPSVLWMKPPPFVAWHARTHLESCVCGWPPLPYLCFGGRLWKARRVPRWRRPNPRGAHTVNIPTSPRNHPARGPILDLTDGKHARDLTRMT
jgi:hypothetical protein